MGRLSGQRSAVRMGVVGCCLSATLCVACAFSLEDVQTTAQDGGSSYVQKDASQQSDAPQQGDVSTDGGAVDGCWPSSDEALCETAGRGCGPFQTTDECGQLRDVSCGICAETAHCEAGACVAWGFAWKTSAWSACSASCDGGTWNRQVWCEREDGQAAPDAYCGSGRPAGSEICNTQACCTPWCAPHDACGSDGCGGTCGSTCSSDPYPRTCRDGYCVWEHGNNGSVTCDTLCSWEESLCVDTSTGQCSVKAEMDCYCW